MEEALLRELQLCILDIAIEFRRICDKHSINYFLVGGTLLGAVRHTGFIPWDDDMDIGMLREEYERFLAVCDKELDTKFFLQTKESDKEYGWGYAKIRINNTKLIEEFASDSTQHNGIYLDIFPYDDLSESKIRRKLRYMLFKCLKWSALGKCNYTFHDRKKEYFAQTMNRLLFFKNKDNVLSMLDKVCKGCKKNKEVINYFGAYGDREHLDRFSAENPVELNFEGYAFKVPVDYKAFLTQMYGDYMKLPAEENRVLRHAAFIVDIGDYKISNNA